MTSDARLPDDSSPLDESRDHESPQYSAEEKARNNPSAFAAFIARSLRLLTSRQKVEPEAPLETSNGTFTPSDGDGLQSQLSDEALAEPRSDAATEPALHGDYDAETIAPQLTEESSDAVRATVEPVTITPWAAVASAVVGDAHRQVCPPIPCQDFCIARADRRPFLILADGLGSACLSHLGANQIVRMVSCYISANEKTISQLIDFEMSNANRDKIEIFIQEIFSFASNVIEDLAQQMAHHTSSFRSTLLFAVVGKEFVLWAQLGDGVIVAQDSIGVKCISPRKDAGWMNTVSALGGQDECRQPAFGTFPVSSITGLAVLSDGAAERLVSNDNTKIAGRLATLWNTLRTDSRDGKQLRKFLLDPEIWSGTTGDDKAIAMIAR